MLRSSSEKGAGTCHISANPQELEKILTRNKLTPGDPFSVNDAPAEHVILNAALASRADNKDTIDLKSVLVALYADGVNGTAPERVEMKRRRRLLGATNGYVFKAAVPATRPSSDYTARVIPRRDSVSIPLENGRILWQR
jgi:hypothetical protein